MLSDNEIEMTVGEAAVTKWADRKKLSPRTASLLIELGYDSMEALSLLVENDLPSTIPVGQKRLLLHSIRQTFPRGLAAAETSRQEPSATTSEAPVEVHADPSPGTPLPTEQVQGQSSDKFISEMLGQLQSAQGSSQPTINTAPTLDQPGMFSWQDPQIYLKSLSAPTSSQYHDIVDFVNLAAASQSERVLSNNEDGQLVFKSGPSKPKLENISLSQWSVANLAILQKLLQENALSPNHMLDYLSYTTRVYQLLASYEIKSVFFYDREYRKLQNLHKFRWGTDIPHIQTVYLKPRVQSAQPNPTKSVRPIPSGQFPPRASHTPQGSEICKRYNTRKGCYSKQCRFSHVCAIPGCAKKHSSADHTASKNG
ncbi:uncharacterized protein LOC134267691 [Saccostrea cucullata]|uniref:uncharacterized protein LOC134267691 n=1 Tax=Saccostrea cuccullata TaxID=36930 RepID=UPI002ED35BA8